jgi:quercetin dioxygenase-like cupin family protein
LRDLVAYQDGAVVSRALLAREAGTVTLFAFAAGQGLSEHTAPYDALVILLEGEADITVSGRPFHLGGGDTLLLPAHKPHALRAATAFKMLLVMIRS